MTDHRWWLLPAIAGLLFAAASAGTYASDGTAKPTDGLAGLDMLGLKVEYSVTGLGLDFALERLSKAARVPICFENKVDRVADASRPAAPLVTVAKAITLGDALAAIMSQAPDYEVFWNRQLGYIHVVRKDLLKDPNWLPNKVVDKVQYVGTLPKQLELIRDHKLGLKGDDAKYALIFATGAYGECNWQVASQKQQIALNVENTPFRDLLDEMGRQLGLAGWSFSTSQEKSGEPTRGGVSFYPAVDPLSLPPEYNAYYKINP